MTTICYRDGILAADTRAYSGDSCSIGQKQKIFDVLREDGSRCVFGISTPQPGLSGLIKKWFVGGKTEELEPVLEDGWGFYALEILEDGTANYYHNCFSPSGPIWGDYLAIGSGVEYALGALAQGATAIEAVVAAAKHDAWTGGEVQHIDLNPNDSNIVDFTQDQPAAEAA